MDNINLSKAVVKLLIELEQTLAIAESITGGMVASNICAVPGASQVFLDGVVSYSNQSKIIRLGVSEKTIFSYSPVSEKCAAEMAKGVRQALNTNIGISTTGVAGPEEFDKDGNPRGLFYIGVSTDKIDRVYEFKVDLDREKNRCFAAQKALEILLELVEEKI